MKRLNSIIIIGCSIPSLYAGIKSLELGYRVTIIEKKGASHPITQAAYNNYNIYNDNHKTYINLLRRFDVKPSHSFRITKNQRLFDIINSVIQKSKLIPNNIIMSHTFASLCKHLISDADNFYLNSNENAFSGLFNIINAIDCINIFTTDITNQCNYYFLDSTAINNLLSKMIEYFKLMSGKIIYNNEVRTIRYIKKKYIISTHLHNTFNSDYLLTTISRDNLSAFGFWNNEQISLLNNVIGINANIINSLMNTIMDTHNTVNDNRPLILDCMHIVYPLYTNKLKYIYIWNNGINNVLIRETIKNMYNDRFIICSESFSKNNMFINYSLEYIDSGIKKLYKIT